MIAKDCGTGSSFSGLARYLLEGKKGESKDRVLWSEGINLPGNDVMTGAQFMSGVANENHRVEKPVYHFSINWHPDESDRVSQAQAIEIGREALADLGLTGHQAIMVAHDDTEHFHLHIMVNRIRTDNFKSWKQGLSKIALEKCMARLSIEHGFDLVPGHHNAEDLGFEPPSPDVAITTEELRFKDRTGELSHVELASEATRDAFEKAESWSDLEARLNGSGWSLEAKGRGLVLASDDGAHVKPSAISREFSRGSLEQRFGGTFGTPKEKPQQPEKPPTYETALSRWAAPQIKAAKSWDDMRGRLRRFGLEVHAKGRGLVLTDGTNETKMSSINRQFSRGALEKRFGQRFDIEASAPHFSGIVQTKKAAIRLDQAVRALDEWHVKRERLDVAVEKHAEVLDRTQDAQNVINRFAELKKIRTQAWNKVYRNPQEALKRFDKFVEKHNRHEAIARFAKNPGHFGKVRGRGVIANSERRASLQDAKVFEHAYKDYLTLSRNAAPYREEMNALLKERRESPYRHDVENLKRDLGIGSKQPGNKRFELERGVVNAAASFSAEELRTLPLMSALRRSVVQKTVSGLREEDRERYTSSFLNRHNHTDNEKQAGLPKTATPREARAHKAVSELVDARRTWLKEAIDKIDDLTGLADKRQRFVAARNKVHAMGQAAQRWLRPFGLDRTQKPALTGAARAADQSLERFAKTAKRNKPLRKGLDHVMELVPKFGGKGPKK